MRQNMVRGVSPKEEILIFLVLTIYKKTEHFVGPASVSPFLHEKMGQSISSGRRCLVTVSAQLILINGLLTLPDTVLKCTLFLLTSNPYYNPVIKMGTILIHIFEDSVHLENSGAKTGPQVAWL